MSHAILLLATLAAREASACSLADIRIERAEVVVQNAVSYLVGRIANACGDETGAQIRVTLTDGAGAPVFAGDFWPAGTRNIKAHDSLGFTYVLSPSEPIPQRRPARMTVEPVALRKW